MSSVQDLLVVGIHISFLLSGIFGNVFILMIHINEWLKPNDFNPSILIISCIAFINILFQGAITFHRVLVFFFLEFYVQVWVVIPLVVILLSLTFSSLWCSTVLCFYYCIKIVNFSGSFFYKLKVKVHVVVPWLLIISIATSWSVGLPAFWDLYIDNQPVTGPIARNVTLSYILKGKCNCLFQIFMLFAAVAFAIIFVTAVAIVTSLCKHMIRMRKNSEGSGNSRRNSLLSAAKTVTSLFLLYLIFYGSLSSILNEAENPGSLILILSFILSSSFPKFNSIDLIMGNSKLSSSLKKFLGMG